MRYEVRTLPKLIAMMMLTILKNIAFGRMRNFVVEF